LTTIKNILLFILLLLPYFVASQQKVKVVTRVIERTYNYPHEFLLEIDAEKADITIETHTGNTVELVLKQTVKNSSEELARLHLDAHKFTDNREKDRLFLKNHILFAEESHAKGSIFRNEYSLRIPVGCHLKIKNSLGNILITGASKSISLDITYGKAGLQNCKSTFNCAIELGELTLTGGTLNATVTSNNSRVKIQSVTGTVKGDFTFGSLSLFLSGAPLVTQINTRYCETTVINKSDDSYKLSLSTQGGKINVMNNEKVGKTSDTETLIINPASTGKLPEIIVKAFENDINYY
jgi:hypothetical protein